MDLEVKRQEREVPDLRERLQAFHDEIVEYSRPPHRVMLVEIINHITRQNGENYYANRDAYSKILVYLNASLRAGKFYYDEL